MKALIGTAGWSLPSAEQEHFPGVGSHLERYAQRFPAVEINSSFHRSHRVATWSRWAASVPPGFLFSVKLPKAITHTRRLMEVEDLLAAFLAEIDALGASAGCLLVQLPPSLVFDEPVAMKFFELLRSRTVIRVACEPRHESWFGAEAGELLTHWRVARVAADPARFPVAAAPGGWRGLSYYRLHGSPKVYYSAYDALFVAELADRIREDLAAERPVWAIFDNTTLGAATRNALDLARRLDEHALP